MKKPVDLEKERRRLPDVLDEGFWSSLGLCAPYTLLNTEKLYNLYGATAYLCKRNIPGSVVECGVYLGGAVMLVAQTLSRFGIREKEIYLYDTFSGFTTPPTEQDINYKGNKIGHVRLRNFRARTEKNLQKVDYPEDNYIFVEGDINKTVLETTLDSIALLRLDTDTYETTRSELIHLYPKIVPGGILIVDDYGYSKGARKAVDEYFDGREEALFFQRPDWSSRTAVKL